MKDSKLAEGGLGKKRDIRLAKKLIKGLQGIDTPAAKEMKALMNEVLAGGYKPVKKKDGGLMEAIEKVKAKKMKEGGDVDKEFPEPKERTAEFRIEMIPKEFRKSFREKFMSGRGETSRKIEEKAKGGPIRTRGQPSPMRAMQRLDDAVEEFIETIEPFQGTVRKGETLRNIDGKTMIVRRTPNPNFGNMISDRDREMIGAMLGEGGRMISDRDRRMVSQMMGARRMEDGGVVPAKFKGFSKLPEDVQQKMNPTLAKKFKKGGAVKMGSGGGVCRGMGAARAGGKFKLR